MTGDVEKMTLSCAQARLALSLLDLTRLEAEDSPATTEDLCRQALEPNPGGQAIAAVCLWPAGVAQAVRALAGSGIKVAAVANFPSGTSPLALVLSEIDTIARGGGQEVDLVLPYHALRAGKTQEVAQFLDQVRRACSGLTLKVILETGALKEQAMIVQASALAQEAGADFLKTSTGKTAVSATPAAVATLLTQLAAQGRGGLKISGGLRTIKDVAAYLDQVSLAMGAAWITPANLRLGTSRLIAPLRRQAA